MAVVSEGISEGILHKTALGKGGICRRNNELEVM